MTTLVIEKEKVVHSAVLLAVSPSSVFAAICLGFTIFGVIFAHVTIF